MNVFDLVAKLTLDSSEYDEGLEQSEEKGSKFGEKLKSGLATGAKAAVAGVTALTTATIAGATAVVNATNDVAAYRQTKSETWYISHGVSGMGRNSTAQRFFNFSPDTCHEDVTSGSRKRR